MCVTVCVCVCFFLAIRKGLVLAPPPALLVSWAFISEPSREGITPPLASPGAPTPPSVPHQLPPSQTASQPSYSRILRKKSRIKASHPPPIYYLFSEILMPCPLPSGTKVAIASDCKRPLIAIWFLISPLNIHLCWEHKGAGGRVGYPRPPPLLPKTSPPPLIVWGGKESVQRTDQEALRCLLLLSQGWDYNAQKARLSDCLVPTQCRAELFKYYFFGWGNVSLLWVVFHTNPLFLTLQILHCQTGLPPTPPPPLTGCLGGRGGALRCLFPEQPHGSTHTPGPLLLPALRSTRDGPPRGTSIF